MLKMNGTLSNKLGKALSSSNRLFCFICNNYIVRIVYVNSETEFCTKLVRMIHYAQTIQDRNDSDCKLKARSGRVVLGEAYI